MAVCASPANVGDRDGAAVLPTRSAAKFPRLRHLWADQGYRGQDVLNWVQEETGITVQIVQRADGGFRDTWAEAETPRLAKDDEYLATSQENVVYLATVMLLLHRAGRSLP
ncbi:hypothetical protein ABT381_07145 [Streptomyces sp. NPDC000151]|uniref:hypothetical protein n=1 Tax=Streptomyces sp. NPDC000151 TaxID=3154244 RepID=UPI00332A8AC2